MKGLFLLLFYIISSNVACAQRNIAGFYKGYEEMSYLDSSGKKVWIEINPSNPMERWYFECYVWIKGDSAFLKKLPGHFIGDNFPVSSTDAGGGSEYKGTYVQYGDTLDMNFTRESCNFCPDGFEFQPDGTLKSVPVRLTYRGKLTETGILINDHLFRRVDSSTVR